MNLKKFLFLSKLFRELMWTLNHKKLKNCKLLVLDVDGVMTDGTIAYDGKNIMRIFSVNDGLGLKIIMNFGIEVALISGGKGSSITDRAAHLGIKNVFTEIPDKLETLEELKNNLEIKNSETIYVGDDLNDLVVKEKIGLMISPLNGRKYIGKYVDCITNKFGGSGSVREVCDRILKAKKFKLLTNRFTITN